MIKFNKKNVVKKKKKKKKEREKKKKRTIKRIARPDAQIFYLRRVI